VCRERVRAYDEELDFMVGERAQQIDEVLVHYRPLLRATPDIRA